MTRFYSQNGEDIILNELFKDKKEGFFVEIGCIDGRRFSNTLTFEERGWKGLCVEAHVGYIELLKKNRPNSIICHCAVGEQDEDDVTFYANARGSLSSLDGNRESYFREKYDKWFTGFEQQKVKKRSLNSIFRYYNIEKIDILSLDIEGYEVQALKGLNLDHFKPRVFVIEEDNADDEVAIDRILIPHGYSKAYRQAQNVFYLSSEVPFISPDGKIIKAMLTHTQHPLDDDGDKLVEVELRCKAIDSSN
jgi:FkbM family methyltransferase